MGIGIVLGTLAALTVGNAAPALGDASRRDPNDVSFDLDIKRVSSRVSKVYDTVHFSIRFRERIDQQAEPTVLVYFDGDQDGTVDHALMMVWTGSSMECAYGSIGDLSNPCAGGIGPRNMQAAIPRDYLPRATDWYAVSLNPSGPGSDRAPNQGFVRHF